MFIDYTSQTNRVMFALSAHISTKAGMDEFHTRGSFGFCQRTKIPDCLLYIVWLKSGHNHSPTRGNLQNRYMVPSPNTGNSFELFP